MKNVVSPKGLLTFVALAISLAVTSTVNAMPRTEIVPGTKVVTRSGKNLRGESKFTVQVQAEVYEVEMVAQEVPVAGSGQSPLWDNFFSARRDQKVAALAAAIKGVGTKTAQKLVAANYFHSKPRSWEEFASRIEAANAEFGGNFAYQVLNTYRQENEAALGYVVAGVQMVPVRHHTGSVSRLFQVHVVNAPLLLGETETFNVIFNGNGDDISVESYFNSYSVRRFDGIDGNVEYELEGQRKAARPANTLGVQILTGNGNLVLQVSDSAFDSDVAGKSRRMIVGTVEVGAGGWQGRDKVATFERPLDDNFRETKISDLGITLPQGKSVVVKYAIRYDNSPYYGSELSPQLRADAKN